MGNYICIADNAIPPVAKYKFQVEVHCKFECDCAGVKLADLFILVKPIVRINHRYDQAVSADFGATVSFKCEVS